MKIDLESNISEEQLLKRLNSLVLDEKKATKLSASPSDLKERIMSDYAKEVLKSLKQAEMDGQDTCSVFVDIMLRKIQQYSFENLSNINVLLKESHEIEMLSLVLRWSMEHVDG